VKRGVRRPSPQPSNKGRGRKTNQLFAYDRLMGTRRLLNQHRQLAAGISESDSRLSSIKSLLSRPDYRARIRCLRSIRTLKQ